MDESRQYASALEMTKRKTVETEKELLSMKSALDVAHKGLDDRNHRLADAQADLEKERLDIDIFKFGAWFLLLLQHCHHVSGLVCCFLNVDWAFETLFGSADLRREGCKKSLRL